MKEEEEDAKPPQPTTVCQENADQELPEVSSGLVGKCLFNHQSLQVKLKFFQSVSTEYIFVYSLMFHALQRFNAADVTINVDGKGT